MSARGVLALVATLTPAGCDYIAPPDPLALDPDVISIAIVLIAGDGQARLLAGHPHRPASDPPPEVEAALIGPGWRAAFTGRTDPADGCGGGPTFWSMPMVCLNAALPEAVREEVTYKLEGEGPKGSFTGETVVPATPRMLDPADTLWLPDTIRSIRIPIRYRAPPEVGTLRPAVFATLRKKGATESKWVTTRPRSLDVEGEADTLSLSGVDVTELEAASLQLIGIGWHYTRFRRVSRTHFPWPNFGVEGEGVYGYFDGSTRSKSVRIVVEDGG